MSHKLEVNGSTTHMTTLLERKNNFICPLDAPGPQYWVATYVLSDKSEWVTEGWSTLAAALRELTILERRHFPSTIESVELFQIHKGLSNGLSEILKDDR